MSIKDRNAIYWLQKTDGPSAATALYREIVALDHHIYKVHQVLSAVYFTVFIFLETADFVGMWVRL